MNVNIQGNMHCTSYSYNNMMFEHISTESRTHTPTHTQTLAHWHNIVLFDLSYVEFSLAFTCPFDPDTILPQNRIFVAHSRNE